jgi:hypothetical protein
VASVAELTLGLARLAPTRGDRCDLTGTDRDPPAIHNWTPRSPRNLLDTVYASNRLKLPLEGVILIGY